MRKLLKPLAIFACAVVLVAGTVAGTLAYLTAKTDTITNTFTVGDVSISLAETTATQLKMIPGTTIAKDPKVTVDANSEDCWLFVKLEKGNNFDYYVESAIAAGWTELTEGSDIYYRQVLASDEDRTFSVLLNDKVTAKNLSKADYEALKRDGAYSYPTLSVTAYAIQLAGFADNVANAWSTVYAAYQNQNQNQS